MVFYEHLGTAHVPGGVEIRLYKHDNDYSILLPDDELMSTRMRASEELLAVESLKRVTHTAAPRMLIGGYGMGFTLRAALAAGGPGLRVTVSEIVPEIIDWALGPMADVTDGCLDDPRVRVDLRDVGVTISESWEAFDTILLDVDNGPDGVVRKDNDGLFARWPRAASCRSGRRRTMRDSRGG